jgi:hypothetical protein
MRNRAATLAAVGVQMVARLALNDDDAPAFDHDHAAAFSALGIPTFACAPDRFPEPMAAVIQRQDLTQWAANHDIVTARAGR